MVQTAKTAALQQCKEQCMLVFMTSYSSCCYLTKLKKIVAKGQFETYVFITIKNQPFLSIVLPTKLELSSQNAQKIFGLRTWV